MAKPLAIKAFKRIILGLIGVAAIAGMFWFINTYIYEFYAADENKVKVDSTVVAKVTQGDEFNVALSFTNNNIKAIDAIDLFLTFDKDKVSYQDTYTVVQNDKYFKTTTGTVTNAGTNKSQLRLLLLAQENVTPLKTITVNLKFKSLKPGTATLKVEPSTEIAGIDGSNNAVTYAENLDNATKQITIEAPVVENKPPTITSYVWEPENPAPGQKGKATVRGTDPDSSTVALNIYLNDKKIGTKENIPVQNGKWTITYDSTAPSKEGTYTSQVEVTDGPNTIKGEKQTFTIGGSTEPSASGIVAHWKMDDNISGNGKTIVDAIGDNDAVSQVGENGTGIDCTTAGKNGKACTFDGVDDRFNGKTTFTFGTKMTIIAWIKTPTGGAIFGSVSSPLSNSFYLRTNNGVVEGVSDMSSNWPKNKARGKTKINDNEWHHIAFVIDDLSAKVYVDGKLDGSETMASMGEFTDSNWYIGYSDASWAPHYFKGQIDDLKIFNYALSDAEIQEDSGITDVEPSEAPTPTPPWVNTDYTTTTVYGIVQDVDDQGQTLVGEYWRKNAQICENADYNNSSAMNVNSNFIDQCTGFNNIPYFLTVVRNPGNNIAYRLEGLPEGYECVSWKHNLRIKSDGNPFTENEGTGCSTGPLNIAVQDETSSYENSHFIWFKIHQVVEPTPTSTLEKYESVLNMKVKFQGIQKAPKEQYSKMIAKVDLKGGGQEVKSEQIEFVAQEGGIWVGSMGVDGINAATKYEILIKGPKHLNKKICTNTPSETLPGTYRCSDPEVSLQKGNNDLDFSNIILLGGDLPQQDGLINALDFAFVRQNLGSQSPDNLLRGDINLDGIIDTQDHTIIKTALDFKYDEE